MIIISFFFCTFIIILHVLLLLIVLGCFNFNTGTFGSIKLKEMKIMLYMLPRCFLLYVYYFNLFVNLLLLLLLIALGCFNFNMGTFGSVKLKEMKNYVFTLSCIVTAVPMCFWYYYCCYLLSLDVSTLTQGPLGV